MCLYFLINFYLFYMASHQLPTRQVSIPTQKVEIKEPEETKTTEKMSWDELINK